ncbi:MAG: hypothetical protein RL094_326 [Candidatus Parcubacteria bacterium]
MLYALALTLAVTVGMWIEDKTSVLKIFQRRNFHLFALGVILLLGFAAWLLIKWEGVEIGRVCHLTGEDIEPNEVYPYGTHMTTRTEVIVLMELRGSICPVTFTREQAKPLLDHRGPPFQWVRLSEESVFNSDTPAGNSELTIVLYPYFQTGNVVVPITNSAPATATT